ncbi:molybdopterin converting factor small subunit [Phycicoccus badiiscoriae]|uniref:Molybdopterin converting factor small subunit n=1 Tax=Pedococcus badiiscoriae TaxID=642776 RepID=A0A852W9W2_9MICO|nr:MoaD/ThiS family protein [Pedococcus badiiscoriae]NYG06007.1 molybdopterin converting factor small subunit [Pedococcus badiiscoriae]
MTARVVLPGLLRDLADGAAELPVELSAQAPLGDVLDLAFGPWPILASRVRDERGEIRRHVNVFVDGEDAKRAHGVQTAVTPNSTVHVINAVSGG